MLSVPSVPSVPSVLSVPSVPSVLSVPSEHRAEVTSAVHLSLLQQHSLHPAMVKIPCSGNNPRVVLPSQRPL